MIDDRLQFEEAQSDDIPRIWTIICQGKEQMRREGSGQWREEYPAAADIAADIAKGYGCVLRREGQAVAYAAVIFDGEPAYANIEGQWLSEQPYATVHRLAVADEMKNRGTATLMMREIEASSRARGTASIRVDTNFDNLRMSKILSKLGFVYCGEVTYGENKRKAYEKLLVGATARDSRHASGNVPATKSGSGLAQREGFVSIVVNFVLFALKLWAGIYAGSIALVADAWHTLSDSLGSVAVVIAAKLSAKKPDKKHPFGHGRWEQIAALFIAFLLAFIAFDFFIEAIQRLGHGEQVRFGPFAIVVTIVSVVVKEALAQYAFRIARKTDNVSVKADGWHHRADALSSLVVLAGIAFAGYFAEMDSVLGILVSLMLIHAAYEIVKETITKLLGEEPDEKLIADISETIRSMYRDDLRPHHFHIHNYVSHRELTFHIKLDGNLSIEAGHQVATDIETSIKSKFNITATVHVEPKPEPG